MNQSIAQIIQQQGILDVVHPNMAALFHEDPTSFTLARRVGLGASDASVYLGVNLYTSLDALITEKRATAVTADEKAIADIEAVRKGRDLEPIILNKFTAWSGLTVEKPEAMYRITAHPQLLINFDGLTDMSGMLIPVEAKFVTQYGTKYYDQCQAIDNWMAGSRKTCGGESIIDHITQEAKLYGIPAYYYTQVQQQMMGVDAPYAFLAVLFDKGWNFRVFKIFSDAFTQQAIMTESAKVWNKIKPSD